ncbi:uncharacterized protein si:ch211-14c7.2 isoform X2 [Esox lucius]|uniref:uncharacterized protein si:ch211-14c7.2 isoform X2 n=1 Tax=Esox lucius TaxID=8010 RepID=UPI001476E8E4|nr:uncharacterized protein si:ch211-14c7.2 isoform X2 [Esox lucius]
MLQQNNNNNYPCLEMAGSTREVLQKCQKSYLPFTSRLELADMPLVKGLRAWAVCSKERRRSAPSTRAPGTCLGSADIYPVGQWGRVGRDLGLPLDSTYSSQPRQAGLGALVTVATLKASEGGGQTQTHCLFLSAESGRCLYSTRGPKTHGQRLVPQTPSTLVGSWLRDKVGGFRDSSVVGKMGVRDMGGATYQVKSRSGRRWRTSCKAVAPIRGKTPTERREDPRVHTLEGSQESGDKGEFPTLVTDTLSGKQDRGNARSLRCCHAQTKTCTECHRRRGEQGNSSRQKGSSSVCVEDQLEGAMEGIKGEGTAVSRLKPCSLPPDTKDPESRSSDVRDGGQPGNPLRPELSHDKDPFQDKTGDEDTGTGGEDVSSGHPRHAERANGTLGTVNGFVEHIKSAERESARLEGNGSTAVGGDQSTGRHCCSERGCLKPPSTQPPTPAGGSTSAAADGTGCGQINPEIKSVSQLNKEGELCGKCLPKEKVPAAVDKEVLVVAEHRLHGEKEKDGEEGIQLTAPEIRELCGEYGDIQPEVRSTDNVTRLEWEARQGDFTSRGAERGPYWATERRESEGTCWTEERCFSGLAATMTEKAIGGGWMELETGQFNSPSPGPATSVTHTPTNPLPPGVMATSFPALEGGQIEAASGAPAPLILSLGEPNRDRDESKVAADAGFLDEDTEGDDGFGHFMQAGEQSSWNDGFIASPLVPSVKSADVTDCSFHQSEGAWTAFQQNTDRDGQDTRREWWPTNAVEETRSRCSNKQNVNGVFVEAFSSQSTPPCDCEAVPTLGQLLRSVLDHESSAKDHGLLDGFHDLNKMIGLKYKRANTVSRERLLHSLQIGLCNTENITGNQAASHSPSLVPPFSSVHTQTCGKRRLSYDLNKNIME